MGHIGPVQALPTKGAELDVKNKLGRTPQFQTLGEGDARVAQRLMGQGAELDTKGDSAGTLLSWAARNGTPAVVRPLNSAR
ncbi:hypothetical protein FGG08_001111 [Glutinoglossum americanum]|uniref:Ankyrin repeat domain-containing protein n=1 Tax=Glutinoglossum americanum TaxID=1670608 RepID=A0A9P8I7H4_9PEZI|nr:hypothetical protein FGG08_001111 [Glutinoglossum americanum]